VNLGLLTPHMAGAAPLGESELGPSGRAFNSAESQQRFLGRQATHVGVLPLLGPGRVLHGMLSLEAECPAATGQELIWRECDERLQLLASVVYSDSDSGKKPESQVATSELKPGRPETLNPVRRVYPEEATCAVKDGELSIVRGELQTEPGKAVLQME
jgi:hypothetical protein